jgi:hypothetical protein
MMTFPIAWPDSFGYQQDDGKPNLFQWSPRSDPLTEGEGPMVPSPLEPAEAKGVPGPVLALAIIVPIVSGVC